MYTDKKNILQLVALLKEHSISKIVLCPGSRNSPIVHTLANHPFFTCYSVTDERSAGFFAMGLALHGGKPAAVCCTSGTALLNIHPAVAEAYYQLGQNEKANKIIDELANKSLEYMIWYLSLTDYQLSIASENFMYNAGLLDAEVRLMEKYKSEELAKHYSEQLDQLYNEYVARMKGK